MNKEKPNKDAQCDSTKQRPSRKRFSNIELTILGSVYVSSNGNSQREVLEGTGT